MTAPTNNLGITAASFVADFPEFANAAQYPPAVITFYIALANLALNSQFWGGPSANAGPPVAPTNPPQSWIDFAAELFVAHNIVLEYQAQKAAQAGAPPGTQTGAVAGKSVGPISINYDNGATNFEDGGAADYNLTVYGKRFWRMVQMAGAGPLQLGLGCAPAWSAFVPGVPWAGPPLWPGWYWNT